MRYFVLTITAIHACCLWAVWAIVPDWRAAACLSAWLGLNSAFVIETLWNAKDNQP